MAIDKLLDAVLVAYVRNKHEVNNVSDFSVDMKDELFNSIFENNTREINNEQRSYISQKLNSLTDEWVTSKDNDIQRISKPFVGSQTYIYDLMNSLRDIDSDVFIENKSL